MSLQHKKITRLGDEYSCARCGKSWAIDDQDPPTCSEAVAIVGAGVRTGRSKTNPEMHNLPREGVKSLEEHARVSDGNHINPDEMRAAFLADYAELEEKVMAGLADGTMATDRPETQDEYYDRLSMAQKRAFAIASTNPGCSQRSEARKVAMSSVFAHEYGKGALCDDGMYIIGLETPHGWKGCAIYAKTGDRAMRYFMGAFGHRLKQEQCNALVLDRVLGTSCPGSLTIPHAELRTVVLKVNSRHNTATGIKYELLSPINFAKAVNP